MNYSPKSSAETPAEREYSVAVSIMTNHLQPVPSILAERCRFRQRRQAADAGENVTSYVAELERLSSHTIRIHNIAYELSR